MSSEPQHIRLPDGELYALSAIEEMAQQVLSASRSEKIHSVVAKRCKSIRVVLENIYDRGNASAVMRTAEGLGFFGIDLIESGTKFKKANRVTQGADKWLEVQKWKSTSECVGHLKEQGFRILVTDLQQEAQPLREFDFTQPTAFVLGNEKDGISADMRSLADAACIVPMTGFVQSYNISVAGALGLYHIFQDIERRRGSVGDLSSEEQQRWRCHYALRSTPSIGKMLMEQRRRQNS